MKQNSTYNKNYNIYSKEQIEFDEKDIDIRKKKLNNEIDNCIKYTTTHNGGK
jgi:hypothetical protein